MKYRVLEFLKDQGIFHRTDGPNCAFGNVVIKCPYCGAADPSEHMGIALDGSVYGCWRNSDHRGQDLGHLFSEVLSISPTEALRRLSSYAEGVALSSDISGGFRDIIQAQLEHVSINSNEIKDFPIPNLKLPGDWMRIKASNPLVRFAYNYLISRDFLPNYIEVMPLYASLTGPYAYRVLFPIYENGQLVSWTGRDTTGRSVLRYKSISTLPEGPDGGWQIKHFIGNYDWAKATPTVPIVITEGPMDSLKLNMHFRKRAIAVCLFNTYLTERQAELLVNLGANGRKLLVCMDPEAQEATLKIWNTLKLFTDCDPVFLPGPHDPGELSEVECKQAFSMFLT